MRLRHDRAGASTEFVRALYCAPMLKLIAWFTCATLLFPTAALAAPKCGVFGTACLHVVDAGGTRLEAFGGTVEGKNGTWDHSFTVEGRTQLMAHATKARVSKCTTTKDACPVTTVEFNGIVELKLGSDPATKGNFIATVVDHADCDSLPDTYSIVIRSGPWIGKGEVVHEASGKMECGGLRVSPAKK